MKAYDLATQLGISPVTVMNYARSAGIEPVRKRPTEFSEEDAEKIVAIANSMLGKRKNTSLKYLHKLKEPYIARIKSFIIGRRLSHSAAARMLGLSQPSITRIMNESLMCPGVETLAKICELIDRLEQELPPVQEQQLPDGVSLHERSPEVSEALALLESIRSRLLQRTS